MRRSLVLLFALLASFRICAAELPFDTVFKGRSQFDRVVGVAAQLKALPLGDRVATIGKVLCGTPYKSSTLEIDDHVEAPSVNLTGLDCWTFFETSLALARMLQEPPEQWKPQTLLKYIERDRYRGGECTGSYLSRLHYLEEWLSDNDRRGLVKDLTRELGGIRAPHAAHEMTIAWKSYRYMRNNPELRSAIADMETRIGHTPLYYIPKDKVTGIESRICSGDVIGVCDYDNGQIGTAHVGLAYRTNDGVLHFMHASSPRNFGKVVLDQQLSGYLAKFRSHAGILVARPLQ